MHRVNRTRPSVAARILADQAVEYERTVGLLFGFTRRAASSVGGIGAGRLAGGFRRGWRLEVAANATTRHRTSHNYGGDYGP